jgi:hypothetical protein
MRHVTRRYFSLAYAIPVLVVLGCAGSPRPRALYPDFRSERTRPLVMLMDVGLVHDVPGDIDELRVYEVQSVADSLAARFRAGLAQKNYRIDRSMLTSMGLSWPSDWEFLTLTSPQQETLASTEKPTKHPPFFTNDSLSRDTMTLTAVGSMYCQARTARALRLAKKPSRLIESAPIVLEYLGAAGGSDLLVVFVSGRDVSRGKKAGRLLLTMAAIAAAAEGSTTVLPDWDNGGVMLDAFIVDGRTGELLWSDSKLDGGARASWPTVAALAARAIEELP